LPQMTYLFVDLPPFPGARGHASPMVATIRVPLWPYLCAFHVICDPVLSAEMK
jgi:hypothetical protein